MMLGLRRRSSSWFGYGSFRRQPPMLRKWKVLASFSPFPVSAAPASSTRKATTTTTTTAVLSRAVFLTWWCTTTAVLSRGWDVPVVAAAAATRPSRFAFRGPTGIADPSRSSDSSSLPGSGSRSHATRPAPGWSRPIGRAAGTSSGSRRWFSSLDHSKNNSNNNEDNNSNNRRETSGEESSFSVETLADRLARSEFTNIVALVGAGASCSAGIPDFRTPGTGLYDRLGKHDLPMPEAVFDLGYYTQVTPVPFVEVCRSIWPGQDNGPEPTPAHRFLKLLDEKHLLRRVYTQNIDGLESLAGIPDGKLVECHGHFRSASCVSCREPAPIGEVRATILGDHRAPTCRSCGGLVKPDIVFFGEELPDRFGELVHTDTAACDLLLVFGTSLLVMPVAGIPSWVDRDCPRVLFNREPAGSIGTSGAAAAATRPDLFLRGDCDDTVRTVCGLAGWAEDLDR